MLNSGKKFRTLRDKKNKYSNSRVVLKKISERNNKKTLTSPPPPPPLQVKWSVPYLNIGSTSAKENAYKTLVRPTLEYASTVWDPYHQKDIQKLAMIQRKGARYVSNRFGNRLV